MFTQNTFLPIYTSRGDLAAFLSYPYIFNRQGEWIGWVTPDRHVYSVHGLFVGELRDGPRILRKVSSSFDMPRREPPTRPPNKVRVPARAPLPPLMAELTYGVMDVLDEDPDLMPSVDFGEGREDLD